MSLHQLLSVLDEYQQQQCPNHYWKDKFAEARRDLPSAVWAGEFYALLASGLGFGELTFRQVGGDFLYAWLPTRKDGPIYHRENSVALCRCLASVAARAAQVAAEMRRIYTRMVEYTRRPNLSPFEPEGGL